MIFAATNLHGLYRVELTPNYDHRGFFARAWCRNEFAAYGASESWAQINLAYSNKRGTLRGMHFQAAPHMETKFVRCVRGAAYVVAVDIRPESPSYLQWYGLEVTADNRSGLLVPKGYAQGYQTLADETELLYQMSTEYVPGAGRGVRYNDPAFKIRWPLEPHSLSENDLSWPDYEV